MSHTTQTLALMKLTCVVIKTNASLTKILHKSIYKYNKFLIPTFTTKRTSLISTPCRNPSYNPIYLIGVIYNVLVRKSYNYIKKLH